jgi:putative transposase
MRVLEYRWTAKLVQVLFSCTPNVAPQFLAARAKGRLDHALRTAGTPVQFSRKTAVRALGDNTRRDVEVYIEQQVGRRDYVDDGFADKLKELTVVNDRVDLAQPTETVRGRYWCNLHLVLVVEQHASIHDLSLLRRLRDSFLRIAEKKDHAVSRLSVMPDHLHAALRTQPDETPLEIVFAYQNNLAHMAGGGSLWQPSFYVGTFGEYSMQAVRNQAGQA